MNDRGISRVEFVRLGALAGMVPMVAALAACGSEESSGAGGESSSAGGGGPETTSETTRTTTSQPSETTSESTTGGGAIALESEVSPGSAVEFQDGGEPAVLVRLDGGDFAAYSAVCTHQGCTVAYESGQGTLNCPCHGSVFDPAQGAEVQAGPAPRPLPEIPIRVSGGEIRRA